MSGREVSGRGMSGSKTSWNQRNRIKREEELQRKRELAEMKKKLWKLRGKGKKI